MNTPRPRFDSLSLAAILAIAVAGVFAALSGLFWHWFVLPVVVCGVLIGSDAIDWVRGRVDVFDPVGLVGLLGTHFFFLAPLLHVYRQYWMPEVIVRPPDWRDWLGYMALLNVAGLLIYRAARKRFAPARQTPAAHVHWEIDPPRFWTMLTCALVASGALQFWIYAQYGGILAYIATINSAAGFTATRGMGWLFMLAETFPIWALMAWFVYARDKAFARSWLVIALVFIVFLGLKLYFGGLRGSRGNIVWGLLGAVGVLHVWIRPIPRKLFLFGGVLLFVFMYAYGFFKVAGLEGLKALGSSETRNAMYARTGRSLDYVVLGDLGRADVQAYLLYKLSRPESDFAYAWGRTYIGGLASVVPSALWPNRPLTKLKEGTEALYGAGTFGPNTFRSSRQYGLAGEALLNFGLPGVPIAFLVFGFLVARVQQLGRTCQRHDPRWFVIPILSVTCFLVLASDSDNIVFILLGQVLLPLAPLFFVTRQVVVELPTGAGLRE